jgi:hypothetical protein
MSFTKTLISTPTCFDQQLIIIREFMCSELKSLNYNVSIHMW